jgi:hypothetical protein
MSTGPINSHPGASEMAETFDGYSTDDCRGFSLLRTWYLYILDQLTHSKDQADIIVQRFFQDGEYDLFNPDRRRYRLYHVKVIPGGVTPLPSKGEFWHSHPTCGIECKINGLNSSALWTGPASAWWRAHGHQFSEYRIDLIWVNDAAMVDFLRGVGFPLTQFDAAQPELPLAEPIHNSPPMSGDADAPPAPTSAQAVSPEPSSPISETAEISSAAPLAPEWDPNTDSSDEALMLNLKISGPKQRLIFNAVRVLRKRSGKSLVEFLNNTKPSALRVHIGLAKISPDACEDFMRAWKAWWAEHCSLDN